MQPHAQSPGKIGRWPRVLRGPRAALLLLVLLLVGAELFLGQVRGYGNPRLVSPHAGAGYALVPDQSIRGPHDTREVINRRGFREREWSAAAGARPRVVVLGHSLSYGVGVEVEQAWPRLVEERLRAGGLAEAMVLNLAVPGYGLDQMLAVYDAAGRELEPDAVVLDLAPYSVRPMVRLVEPADFPLSRWIRRSALFDWVRRRRHTGGLESSAAERVVRDPHDPANDALWRTAYERLDALHAELTARGARLMVLATPRLEEILGAGVGETRWRAWCESREGVLFVSCADALEASMPGLIEELRTRRLDPILPRGRVARLDGERLKFGGESSFFLDDMQHLTPRGHAIVAELVAGILDGLPDADERAAPATR